MKDVTDWIKTRANEITWGRYLQTADQMLAVERKFENVKKYQFLL
jgi:hypothetical protein